MRLLTPIALTWLVAALVPLVLYLIRPRARRQPVSTLLFFRTLAREHQESAWLRRLKRLLSFLMTLLVIAGTVLALGGLVIAPPSGAVRNVVILIDRSASMAAVDGSGHTRVDEAARQARACVAGLPGGTAVSVVAYDNRTSVLLAQSHDRRAIGRAIDSLEPRPIEGNLEVAMPLAKQIAGIESPAEIWHFTDAPAAAKPSTGESITLHDVCVALPAPRNVGVTAFEMRRAPMERDKLEAFVQLSATGTLPAEASVRIRRNRQLVAMRTLSVPPGGHEHLLMPLAVGRKGDVLKVDVESPGDALAFDNRLLARVPAIKPIDVVWISREPDAVTQFALQSLGNDSQVRIFAGGPDAWPPKEPVDVAVFEGWLPETWPDDVAVIAIKPDRSLGPIVMTMIQGDGLRVDSPRATQDEHPVLYGVAAGRVSLKQTSVLDADSARSGLDPLLIGPAGPVLAVGEVEGNRVVVLPFSPVDSENLWRLPSYPLLIGNAIYWATQPRLDTLTGNNRKTGDLIETEGTSITWSASDNAEKFPERLPITGKWVEADQIGLWSTDNGDEGSAALLSPRETNLPMVPTDASQGTIAAGFGGLSGDLTIALLSIVCATLIIESWLFHRHSVY